MKHQNKPSFSTTEKVAYITILVILSPIIIPIFFLMILFMIGKMFLVYVPALREIQTVPRYWLTWKHVKLLTGLSTKNTLSLLMNFADGKFIECRLREDVQLARIKRLRKDGKVPTGKKPFFPDHVIYYEFRMVWRGGRRRPSLRDMISQSLGSMQPKPAVQPAYAR